jgi:hypothetical protein
MLEAFFLKLGYAYAEVVQLSSELNSQFVDEGFRFSVSLLGLGHSFGYDLSHFVTGHGFVATESAVAITVNYAGFSQFGNCAVSPVLGRNVNERVRRSGECGAGDAEHKNEREQSNESFLH